MRKIIVIGLAALLGALSCEVLPEPAKLSSDGIRFYVKDIATKTTEVTASTLASSGFNVSATSGTSGSEAEVFTNAAFSLSSGAYSGGQFWPLDEPAGGYHFYASNAALTYHAGGATVSALNSTDVVCAYLPDPDFGEENELTFTHIFARLDTVKVVAESGYTISNVSIRVTPKTGGTYDLRAGAGHVDGTGWSSPVTGSETAVATVVGSNVPDLYMVPGTYTMKVSWTATKGGSVENFTDETVDFALEAGKRSEVTFTLGGNATDMKFSIAVTPWAVTAVSPAGHDLSQPLTFEIISDGTIVWKCSNASIARTIYYRKNGGDWTEITSTTSGTSIDVVEGDILEFYGVNTSYGTVNYNCKFDGTAYFYAYGNVNSLIDYNVDLGNNNTAYEYCFRSLFNSSKIQNYPSRKLYLPGTNLSSYCYYFMFQGCTGLTEAPELPATTLAERCYANMFQNCSGLTEAPELPATTLASGCYANMFNGCLFTAAPELPATTLASNCYLQMFYNCANLTAVPVLPATTLAPNCYEGMFSRCTSLTVSPELPATTLANGCYLHMFSYCTNFTVAPVLPATTLAPNCYEGMFIRCTSLTVSPVLPATSLANSCYLQMFQETGLISAPELPATTLANNCYSDMFSYCMGLTSAPELLATTLVTGCYRRMFESCNNLEFVKCLATDISASDCLTNWLRIVKSTGTFVKHPDMTSWPSGNSGIPSGWTVEDAVI